MKTNIMVFERQNELVNWLVCETVKLGQKGLKDAQRFAAKTECDATIYNQGTEARTQTLAFV